MGLYDFPYRNLDDKKRVSKLYSNFKTLPNPNKRNVKGQYSFFFFCCCPFILGNYLFNFSRS